MTQTIRRLVAPLLASLLVCTPAYTRTWHVLNDGSGNAPTVQAGIDSAASGDTVLVAPGTYFENISFLGRDIVLKSLAGPESTTLDGRTVPTAVVTFQGSEGQAAVLEGFTITEGRNTLTGYGGGVACNLASPRIINNIIRSNEAKWGGGLLAGRNDSPDPADLPYVTLEGNQFLYNIASHGGGAVVLYSARSSLRGNVFRGNSTLIGDGGAINVRLDVAGQCEIRGNEFWENNSGDKGGAVLAYQGVTAAQGSYEISENLFIRNTAHGADVGDSGAGGGIYGSGIVGEISNNTFVGNLGEGESFCGGGAITLTQTYAYSLYVLRNIIADNGDCGIACHVNGLATFGVNLLWGNGTADLGAGSRTCPGSWSDVAVFEAPQFCGAEADNYTVSASSPAIVDGVAMGAFPVPGCPPVAVHLTTWGSLKARYDD